MGALSPTHWLIAIGMLVLLFGAKRLPDAARSLGRSARILKAEAEAEAEVKDMGEDATAAPQRPTPAVPTAAPAQAPVAAAHDVPAGAAGPDTTR